MKPMWLERGNLASNAGNCGQATCRQPHFLPPSPRDEALPPFPPGLPCTDGRVMQGYGCHGEDASVYIHLSPKAAYCLCSGSDLSTIELQRHFKTNAELFINTLYSILVPETQHAILAIAFLLYIAVLYSSLPRSPSSFGPISIFLIVYFAAKWARGIKGPEQGTPYFPPTAAPAPNTLSIW